MTTSSPADPAQPDSQPTAQAATRLTSIDAYRGLVMFLMMAEVLRLCKVASAFPDSGFWKFLCHHQTHAEWTGCSLHDLIQPSFSFLVGVALPFSIASRKALGQSGSSMTFHAAIRSIVLVLLGVFLRSIDRSQTNWTLEDTLSQIGLGYLFLFALGFRPVRDQWIALGVILVGYWAAFASYPAPGAEFDYQKVGVSGNWPYLMTGFAAHWNKNSNLAWAFDTWFLNLLPRPKPFLYNGGGYATLSFIPTLGTMVLGLIAGGVLRGQQAGIRTIRWLVATGLCAMALGWLFGALGICPIVKRIWTPSWTLFSGGWCLLLMAGFYFVTDLLQFRRCAFPLTVIGMNSIAAYCMAHLFEDFVSKSLKTHLGGNVFGAFGAAYEPLVRGGLVLAVFWLLLFWMYRRKVFLRI
jgi:predicted acyltransferase